MTHIEGERVVLRPMRAEDIAPLTAMLSEPEIAQWWIGYDEAALRAETLDAPDVRPFAIELPDGTLIGLLMYSEETDPHYRSASVDLTLGTAWLGQGLGSDALRAAARYLFEVRGHHRLTIDPAVVNERAIAAYRKVGFKPVGVMREYELGAEGVWRDGLLMDLLARELT